MESESKCMLTRNLAMCCGIARAKGIVKFIVQVEYK